MGHQEKVGNQYQGLTERYFDQLTNSHLHRNISDNK